MIYVIFALKAMFISSSTLMALAVYIYFFGPVTPEVEEANYE